MFGESRVKSDLNCTYSLYVAATAAAIRKQLDSVAVKLHVFGTGVTSSILAWVRLYPVSSEDSIPMQSSTTHMLRKGGAGMLRQGVYRPP